MEREVCLSHHSSSAGMRAADKRSSNDAHRSDDHLGWFSTGGQAAIHEDNTQSLRGRQHRSKWGRNHIQTSATQ